MSRFFDTNVLVYAFLASEKREPALEALADGGVISAQVLGEFTNVARRKHGRSWSDIDTAITIIRNRFPDILPITAETHARALKLAQSHDFAFYDALIVASALESGCRVLFSEDMQHGRKVEGLTIRNPFAARRPRS